MTQYVYLVALSFKNCFFFKIIMIEEKDQTHTLNPSQPYCIFYCLLLGVSKQKKCQVFHEYVRDGD